MTVVDLSVPVPGKYILVDHALIRMEKGLVGALIVEGPPMPEIFRANGEAEKAIGHYREALASDPAHVESHATLGRVLAECVQQSVVRLIPPQIGDQQGFVDQALQEVEDGALLQWICTGDCFCGVEGEATGEDRDPAQQQPLVV